MTCRLLCPCLRYPTRHPGDLTPCRRGCAQARGARSYCKKAMEKLGLQPIDVRECIKATADSYIDLGLVDASVAKL